MPFEILWFKLNFLNNFWDPISLDLWEYIVKLWTLSSEFFKNDKFFPLSIAEGDPYNLNDLLLIISTK